MNFQKIRRVLAISLCCALLFLNSAAAIGDGLYYEFPIGIGTQYARIDGYNDSGPQKSSIVTYKPGTGVSPIGVRSGRQFYGHKQTISQAAAALEKQGMNVVAGINADFFTFSSGVPTGLVVDNGRLVAANTWQHAIGFNEDGSAVIGMPVTNIIVSGSSGKISVFEYNKTRTDIGLYLLDHYFADETGFSSPGQSLVMEYDDPSRLKIGEPISLTVVNKISSADSFPIGENQMILTRRDDCTAMPWIDFKIGERVTIDFQTNDPAWGNVKYAVGGKKLISNGSITTAGIDGANSKVARSAVGIKSDGSILLYEIDGAQSQYSRGITARQLGEELKSLGCIDALALDGGGSSAMTIKKPGASSAQIITQPSDGSPRKCSTYIFLVNNTSATGTPTHLYLEPSSRYVLAGSAVDFTVQAVDDHFYKSALPENISYTASAGQVNAAAHRYQTPEKAGRVSVKAAAGGASGEMTLMVITEPTSASIMYKNSAVNSIALSVNQSAALGANLYYNGLWVYADKNRFKWSVSGDIGTITPDGVFTATHPGTGKLTLSFGSYKKSITVSVGIGAPQKLTTIADFESTQPFTASEGASVNRTSTLSEVFRGMYALRIKNNANQFTVSPASPVSTSGLSILSMWAKTSSGTASIAAQFTDAAGEVLSAPMSAQAVSGYAPLTCNIPAGAQQFIGFDISQSAGSNLFLDHIQLSERQILHSSYPSISITKKNLNVQSGESTSVTATISQANNSCRLHANKAFAYVDGVRNSAAYNAQNGTLTVKTPALRAGTHFITIVAEDDSGNLSRKTLTVNAGKRTDSPFADMANNWSREYVNLLHDRGIMNGSVGSDGRPYYHPSDNLKRSEFAVIMANVLSLNTSSVGDLPFADANKIPSWARASVSAVSRAGIMSGQLDGNTGKINFNPDAEITRAEVMSVISRCLPRGYQTRSNRFTDAASIPSWAVDQVNYVASVGIINGYADGSVKPMGKITRAEIAVVICNFR